jgi:hypothetical protein
MKKFTNPLDPENVEIKKAIQDWVIEKFSLDKESCSIIVSEYTCKEPHCVYSETIISIKAPLQNFMLSGDGIIKFRITKPLVYIRKNDIHNLKQNSFIGQHKH